MKTINAYIVRETLIPLFGSIAVALLVLLLIRLLDLVNFAAKSGNPFFLVFQMLANLIPFYMEVALPAAFFLGVLLAFVRLNQDNELTVMSAAGIGLYRLVAPVMALAVVFTLIAAVTFGYLQSYGRYGYRALRYAVTHASLNAALTEGAFIRVRDATFMADRVYGGGARLSGIFIYVDKGGGKSVVMTAPDGALLESRDDFVPVLHLRNGLGVTRTLGGGRAKAVSFQKYALRVVEAGADASYRARGRDEEELTLTELWAARHRPPPGVEPEQVITEFHDRLVRIFSMLVLPLLAVPLGMAGQRGHRSYSIAIGVLVLIVYHKALEFGAALSSFGSVSPWLGLWAPFAVFVGFGCYLFHTSASRITADPLGALIGSMEQTIRTIRAAVRRRKPRIRC